MNRKGILPLASVVMFVLSWLIGKYGLQWGLTAEHTETTEGLLIGIGLGLLMWTGFVFWKGDKQNAA